MSSQNFESSHPFIRTLEDWPKLIRGLVQQHGSDRVWQAGMEALRYPPAWIRTYAEVKIVADFLAASA